MICLARAGLPSGFLRGHDLRQPIQVGNDTPVHRLIKGKEPRLMRQELPHCGCFLALLREFRPIRTYALLKVQPSPRMGKRHGHGRQPLGSREDEDHRVLFPRLAGRLIANAPPQIDHLFALVVDAAGAPQLVAARKILCERLPHALKPCTRIPVNLGARRNFLYHGTLLPYLMTLV